VLFAGLHLVIHIINAIRKASSENEAERQEGQGCLMIVGGLFGYGLVAALIRAVLLPFFGDTDGVAAASFILPAAVLVMGFVGVRMRAAKASVVPAAPASAAAPSRPPVAALDALGMADVARHFQGTVALPCEGIRRRPDGPLWEATLNGGTRVVFEPLDAPTVERGRIHLVAFAVDATAWPDPAAYAATEDAMPLGTLFADADLRDDDVDDRPIAFLVGRILDVVAERELARCRVTLPGGGALAVVGEASRIKGTPVRGGVLEGTFWLSTCFRE